VRELEQLLVAHVAAHGPIGFDELQAHALYAPGLGFYAVGGGAGRGRDFLTSPEVGPLFGAVIARALDAWWRQLGAPRRLHVVECGAGPGTLARSILAARPACIDALSYLLVELGEPQWATHPEGTRTRADLPSAGELADGPIVVLANELLDNLPVALVERGSDGWHEVGVGVAGDRLIEVARPLTLAQVRWCARFAPDAPVGARVPVQAHAASWLEEALGLLDAHGGRVVAIDYARPLTAELAGLPQERWLRTYAAHGRGSAPLDAPGTQDITCDVALDQLGAVAAPTEVRSQDAFLRAHGIDELVEEGRALWSQLGPAGGLRAIAGRSRVGEAEALLDPDGLGGFTVAEWQRDA
jgi:SAM-dependent MidA family methyltransferase